MKKNIIKRSATNFLNDFKRLASLSININIRVPKKNKVIS